MNRYHSRVLLSLGLVWAALLALSAVAQARDIAPATGTIAPAPPVLTNPSFECSVGYVNGEGNDRVPTGWTAVQIDGDPRLHSTREWVYDGDCNPSDDRHVERLELDDSLMIASQNIETPPTPGKPFDVAIFQQTAVTPGADYSLSGWMVSLCGGSATPSDCPDGVYIAKMLGIDPTGGADPEAESVIWVENRANFVEADGVTRIGWQNLRTSAVAQAETLTVFARVRSPFQWHGNHAFADAISLVRAPTAAFINPPAQVSGPQLTLRWSGAQSPDVLSIPGSTHQLLIDVQTRPQGGEWRDVADGALIPGDQGEGQADFTARCLDTTYEFRIRARAEQPPADEGGEGAWPNHRFPGSWSEPVPVRFQTPTSAPAPTPPVGDERIYLPLIQTFVEC
jgi:hypothetical protein